MSHLFGLGVAIHAQAFPLTDSCVKGSSFAMRFRTFWLSVSVLSACKYHPPEPPPGPQYQAYGAPACGSPCYAPQNYGAPQYAQQAYPAPPYGAPQGYAQSYGAPPGYAQPYAAPPAPQPYAQPAPMQPNPPARVQTVPRSTYVTPVAPAPAPPPPPARPSSPFAFANLDPNDDGVVGPPEEITDCLSRLSSLGVRAHAAKLAVHTEGQMTCGAPQVVVYEGGPAGVKWSSPPMVTCQVALGLSRFETILQEEAQRTLATRVKRIVHMGTYSCRPMVRFNLASEHSFANAIDIQAIELENGKRVTVLADWGPPASPPGTANSRFIQTAGHRAYDEDVFSNVLSPAWDALHNDHLHLDQARYRVDGTRVR